MKVVITYEAIALTPESDQDRERLQNAVNNVAWTSRDSRSALFMFVNDITDHADLTIECGYRQGKSAIR